MKKYVLLLLFFLTLFSFSACSEIDEKKELIIKDNVEYTGFSDIHNDYTPKEAKKKGCLVVCDDKNVEERIIYGEDQWQAFLEKSAKGENAFLRVAQFIGDEGYYQDLYYQGNTYYQFIKDEYGIRSQVPFKYLRALVGRDGIPKREVTLYVLTDSLELTCEDVLWSFYSSNIETVTKIPFVWLGFTTYLEEIDEK